MGIQDIATFIKKKDISYGRTIQLSKYRHKIVCIDAGTFYSRMMINNKSVLSRKTAKELLDPEFELAFEDIVPGLLSLFLPFIGSFLSCNVIPLVVFDGSSPEAKSDTRAKRNAKTKEAQDIVDGIREKYLRKKVMDPEEVSTLRKKLATIFYIKKEHFDVLKEVLKESDLPYLQSKEEAERLCVSLVKEGVCRSAYSIDSDMIAHLCPNWMQQMNNKVYPVTANIIKPNKIAKKLNLTEEQLVEFCIMCGCDYNERVPGVGTINSYKKLIQYGSIAEAYTKKESKNLKVSKCKEMFSTKLSVDIIDFVQSFRVTVEDQKCIVSVNIIASSKEQISSKLSSIISGSNMSSFEKFNANRIQCCKYWKKRQEKKDKKQRKEQRTEQ